MTPEPSPAVVPADAASPLIDPDVPWETRRYVYQALMLGIRGKGILRGERPHELVARVCPDVFAFAEMGGVRVNLDLPENTHDALCRGVIAVEIRRVRR